LLSHIFADWGPDLRSAAGHYNDRLSANSGLPAGSPSFLLPDRRVVHPMPGPVSYLRVLAGRRPSVGSRLRID